MRYVLPRSLTWWAGLAAILIGLAGLLLPEHGQLAELAARRRRADRREGCRAGDADHARLRADRPARPAGTRLPRREGASMKALPAGLQAHLDSGATTLAWCWRIARRDGVVLGFTDHDRSLTFGGTEFEPESGFAASELRAGVDLAVDAQDAEGVLSSDRITETDILDGRWDDAEVEVWRVNWQDVSEHVLMRRGAIGQIRRGRLAFAAEVRSLAHVLGQTVGRTFQATCDAALGDARCGVDLDDPAFCGSGSVTALVGDRGFTASGLGSFAAGWFALGTLDLTSGANAGRTAEVAGHAPRRWHGHHHDARGAGAAGHGGRRLHDPRRLRQAHRDLRGRSSPTSPTSAASRTSPARTRCCAMPVRAAGTRARCCESRRSRTASSRPPAAGSARPTMIRRACRAWAATASGWRAASGARSSDPSRSRSRPTAGTGARPGRVEVLAEGARTAMIEIAPAEAGAGALLLFRMRPRAIAKHVGIVTTPDRLHPRL